MPPQVLKFNMPVSKPVLTWQICGVGVAVTGGARVEVGWGITMAWVVELQANMSKSRRIKSVLMFIISVSFSNSPAPKQITACGKKPQAVKVRHDRIASARAPLPRRGGQGV